MAVMLFPSHQELVLDAALSGERVGILCPSYRDMRDVFKNLVDHLGEAESAKVARVVRARGRERIDFFGGGSIAPVTVEGLAGCHFDAVAVTLPMEELLPVLALSKRPRGALIGLNVLGL